MALDTFRTTSIAYVSPSSPSWSKARLPSRVTRLIGVLGLCGALWATTRRAHGAEPGALWEGIRSHVLPTQQPKIWPGAPADVAEEVALCTASKDLPLDEWLLHHYHHLGIRRFYIMDDRSDPPYETRQDWPIPRSALTFRWHGADEAHDQWSLFNECFASFGHLHKWIAIIDNDEFFELAAEPGRSLAEFMRDYEDDCAELGVNWLLYTSGGHLKKQPDYRHHYTQCSEDFYPGQPHTRDAATPNRFMKSIVQPRYFAYAQDAHTMKLIDNSPLPVCDEYKRQTYNDLLGTKIPTHDKINVHHYFSKSKEEFAIKIGMGGGDGVHKDWSSCASVRATSE